MVALLLARLSSAVEFWVATDGSDTHSGTRTQPFATLERARDALVELKHKGRLPKGGVTISLRGGHYFRTNAFELTVADSGTPDSPIVWRAYKNEPVRLLGGRRLTGFAPVIDRTVVARLDEKARGNIVQLNLREI